MPVLASLQQAWRSLRRTPVFAATSTLTLIIGLCAAVTIFVIVNGVLLQPLLYGDPGRLVGAWHELPPLSISRAQQTAGTYFTYRQFAHTIEDIGVYQPGTVNVSQPGAGSEPRRLAAAWVSVGVIPLLQVPPALGRSFSDTDDLPTGPKVLIIGDALWRNAFGGDRRILGRTLEVNGLSREIVGVMPRGFERRGSQRQANPNLLAPAEHHVGQRAIQPDNREHQRDHAKEPGQYRQQTLARQ